MIWHIFKKDLRLSWKIALAAAVVQWLDAVLVIAVGSATSASGYPVAGTAAARLEPLRQLVHVLAFVATALAAVTAVHNDPLPPPTDDWLVRPIRRIDMMLAKVVFFLIAIEGPIFLGSLAASIGLGLGLPQAIYPAIVHAFATAVWFGLFSLGLGAVTSNVVEALLGGFACLVLFGLMFSAGNATRGAAYYGNNGAVLIGALTAGIAISGLLAFISQFQWRKTRRSRAIALTVFAAGAAVSLLPTSVARALAEGVSEVSPTAWRIHLVPDPPGGRQSAPWLPTEFGADYDLSWLAFRVTGMRPGESLVAEPQDTNAVVTDEAGTLRLRDPFFVDNHGFVWLGIHGNERRNLKHAVSVFATYSFAVVREAGNYPIIPDGSSFRVPGGLGRCRVYYLTGSSGDGAMSCVSPLPNSVCFELSAQHEQIHFPCRPDPSSTVSWLWDWNDLPRSGGGFYAGVLDRNRYLHAYERTGSLAGQIDLPSVQPGDWLAPSEQ